MDDARIDTSRIKITSNPYEKKIEYCYWDKWADSWKQIDSANNPDSRLSIDQVTRLRDDRNYTPTNNQKGITYIAKFEKGAFDVDARNFTDKEAQGIVITAFESMNPTPTNNGGA